MGNPQFQISNQFLDARIKQIKQGGKEKIQHKPAIPIEDLKKVKESGVHLHRSGFFVMYGFRQHYFGVDEEE